MKKVGLFLATILTVSLVWNYFLRNGPVAQIQNSPTAGSNVPQSVLKKNVEAVEIKQSEIVIKKEFVDDTDVEQKTAKALRNIRKKSRIPTAAIKVDPEMLVAHPTLQGTRWKIWLGVRAGRLDGASSSEAIVAKLSHFDVIEVSDVPVQMNDFDRTSPIVVYETRLKKPGLVTGLIKIETERKDLLFSALYKMNAQIENSFEQIQTYYVSSVQTRFDLEKLYLSLKALSFVKSAELDILDRDYEKK